jgi:hypothetical protein
VVLGADEAVEPAPERVTERRHRSQNLVGIVVFHPLPSLPCKVDIYAL